VTGITDNREVPAHFFSRDQELLNAIADWEWTPGLMPDTNKSAWRMSELRAQLINAFSTL
jgi:hypothetical protein